MKGKRESRDQKPTRSQSTFFISQLSSLSFFLLIVSPLPLLSSFKSSPTTHPSLPNKMSSRFLGQYKALYRYLFRAVDIGFTDKVSASFMKESIRREFRETRSIRNSARVQRNLTRGHNVLSVLSSEIEQSFLRRSSSSSSS
jgi:hypothetical protein